MAVDAVDSVEDIEGAAPSAGGAAATAFTLTTASTGTAGTAQAITVSPNGALAAAESVTLTDDLGQSVGTLNFASGSAAPQSVGYTPAAAGGRTLTGAVSPALGANPTAPVTVAAAVTYAGAFTIATSATGTVGVGQTLTVGPNGPLAAAETVTVTDDTGQPVGTLAFAQGAQAPQFLSYVPITAGARTLTGAVSPALGADPTALVAVAAAVASTGLTPIALLVQAAQILSVPPSGGTLTAQLLAAHLVPPGTTDAGVIQALVNAHLLPPGAVSTVETYSQGH